MINDTIADHLAQTVIQPIAWQRAGLPGDPRPTLAGCTLGELLALMTIPVSPAGTTPEGLAFRAAARSLHGWLEARSGYDPDARAVDVLAARQAVTP